MAEQHGARARDAASAVAVAAGRMRHACSGLVEVGRCAVLVSIYVRTRSTTTRDRKLQFRGAVSTGFFSIFSSGFFPFSPGSLCSLVRKWPQNVEKIARLPGGEKSVESCHVCGCCGYFGHDYGIFVHIGCGSALSFGVGNFQVGSFIIQTRASYLCLRLIAA